MKCTVALRVHACIDMRCTSAPVLQQSVLILSHVDRHAPPTIGKPTPRWLELYNSTKKNKTVFSVLSLTITMIMAWLYPVSEMLRAHIYSSHSHNGSEQERFVSLMYILYIHIKDFKTMSSLTLFPYDRSNTNLTGSGGSACIYVDLCRKWDFIVCK